MPELKQGSYTRTQGAPQADNAMVMFHMEERQDTAATMREGRPIFHSIEMIEIRLPGNPYNVWDVPVTDEHRQKYERAYTAFRKGEEVAQEGTPIESLTVLNRAQVKELKYFDIFTVEQAATMDDRACQQFMGGFKLRELAKKYLESAQGLAPLANLTEENDKLKSQLATQANQIEELNRMMVGMKRQLDTAYTAPNPPEYAHPGSLGGLQAAVPTHNAAPPAPVLRSSLDALDEPMPVKPARKK